MEPPNRHQENREKCLASALLLFCDQYCQLDVAAGELRLFDNGNHNIWKHFAKRLQFCANFRSESLLGSVEIGTVEVVIIVVWCEIDGIWIDAARNICNRIGFRQCRHSVLFPAYLVEPGREWLE